MAIYDNKQVQEYVNEVLDTYLGVEAFCEVDNTLVANPGDTVEIYRYSDTGAAEKLAEGEGNTGYSDIEGTSYKFSIITTQDRTKITDEEVQRNPYVASNKVTMIAKHIINALRGDVVGQWYATDNIYEVASTAGLPTVSELILSQSEIDLGVDNGLNGGAERCVFFLNPRDFRKFQAYLISENVIIGSEIIKGVKYSTVAGIPFQASDLIIEGSPVMATDKAVRMLRAKCVNTASERDENVRTSTFYNRLYNCVGLEFEKKALIFGQALTVTKTAPSNGTFDVAEKTVANATLKIKNITPATGYQIGAVTVTGSAGTYVPVKVDDSTYEVKVQDEDITVAVIFSAI